MLSYLATLILGLPIHLFLRRRWRTGLLAYLGLTIMGIAVASGLAFLMEDWFAARGNNPFAFTLWSRNGVILTLLFAAVACLCASIFWFIAVRRSRT